MILCTYSKGGEQVKTIGITKFRQNMKKTIESLKKNEKIEVLQNNEVLFTVIKKGE